ncbi:amidohydrolase family protein [Pelagicoccus sp. SDUM812005]|uniref:amidohydrolase family protein n=1 Tax=Pelagicoccus sp. SDUM812005 TaxID=3041257 RepID=UPI0028101E9F|nr:amidohydrolase family protein [Pelagicoccus sp. SDUM812005]MDQ8181780.1 amidohydrolase family protein [Pelagicoccus sp. SDUM812005]
MAIDSHIHLYPPSVYLDPSSWAKPRGEAYWLSCVQPPRGRSLQTWKTVDELLSDMDEAGIEKAILLAWYWENHDTCLENLSWQLDWQQRHPDRLACFAPFNAKGETAAIELLRRAFDAGFKGFGELNPPAQGYRYDDPTLAHALELAAEYGVAANFHVTDPTTHDYPGKIDTPYRELLALARAHPRVQFVFAHLGGCEPLRSEEQIPDNIAFDTAACPLLYKPPVYREFCDKVGSQKVLFGTDYPLRVFPRDKRAPDFATPLAELHNSELSAREQTAITADNAKRIFALT